MTATPITSAPASCSASAAVSGLPPVVETSSTRAPPALDVRALDPPLQAVRLARLADDARVEEALAVGGGVQHRRRHRVGAEGEPADDVVAQIAGQLAHHPTDQRRALVVQRQPAHVDVPVGLAPGGQRDPPVHDGELDDQLAQPLPVGGWRRSRGPPRDEGGGERILLHAPDPTQGQDAPCAPLANPPRRRRAATVATAVAGGRRRPTRQRLVPRAAASRPGTRRRPPSASSGPALYAGIAWAGGEVLERSGPDRPPSRARWPLNLALNAGWTPLFFRAHRPALAAAECAVLTVSTADLVRRARPVSRPARGGAGALRRLDGVRHGAVGGDRPPQPLTAAAGSARLRRLEHLVDDVDGRVRGLHVAAEHGAPAGR